MNVRALVGRIGYSTDNLKIMFKRVSILCISLGMLLAGCSNKHTAEPSESAIPIPSVSAKSLIQETTQAFYNEYLECSTAPPAEAKDNVGEYCQSHNSHATQALPANLKRGGVADRGADPIMCAQSFPMTFSVEAGVLDSDGVGHAVIIEQYGANSRVLVSASVLNYGGKLLVDNITCPVE